MNRPGDPAPERPSQARVRARAGLPGVGAAIAIVVVVVIALVLSQGGVGSEDGSGTPSAPPESTAPESTAPESPATPDIAPSPVVATLRTFAWADEIDGVPTGCDTIGVTDPVYGTLDGDASVTGGDAVWLLSRAGQRTSIVWPEGFEARFEPEPSLYDETGRLVAANGHTVMLQVERSVAAGTFEDPYYASGILLAGPTYTPDSFAWATYDRCYAALPGAVPTATLDPALTPPPWPSTWPALTVAGTEIDAVSQSGCGALLHGELLYGVDSCGSEAFPFDRPATAVERGTGFAVTPLAGTRFVHDPLGDAPPRVVRARLVRDLAGFRTGEALPDDERTWVDDSSGIDDQGRVVGHVPPTPGDWIVEVWVGVAQGEWVTQPYRIYYRLEVD